MIWLLGRFVWNQREWMLGHDVETATSRENGMNPRTGGFLHGVRHLVPDGWAIPSTFRIREFLVPRVGGRIIAGKGNRPEIAGCDQQYDFAGGARPWTVPLSDWTDGSSLCVSMHRSHEGEFRGLTASRGVGARNTSGLEMRPGDGALFVSWDRPMPPWGSHFLERE
jgi:hypothetical protein